jgi:hypothetical protein
MEAPCENTNGKRNKRDMHINKKFIKIRVLLVTSNFPDRKAWLFLIENDPLKTSERGSQKRELRRTTILGVTFPVIPQWKKAPMVSLFTFSDRRETVSDIEYLL